MKCPKYIKEKIMKRALYANKFNSLDLEISVWLDENHIDTEHQYGYVDDLVNPDASAIELLKDIERA